MKSHRERFEMVRTFTEKNRVFSVIAVILVVYIVFSLITNKDEQNVAKESSVIASQSEVVSGVTKPSSGEDVSVATTQTSTNFEDDETRAIGYNKKRKFRFHWLDLCILAVGSGFCVYKIVQERKKVREKL